MSPVLIFFSCWIGQPQIAGYLVQGPEHWVNVMRWYNDKIEEIDAGRKKKGIDK